MPTNNLTSNNLTNTQPRQDAKAAFGRPLTASSIATGSSLLVRPVIGIKANFTATSLAASAAGIGKPAIVILSATSLVSTAIGFDTPGISFPNIAAVRSISSIAYGNRTNITLAPPAGLIDNDILLAFIINIQIGAEANTIISAPSGFIPIGTDQIVNNSGTFLRGAVYWKRAANESGNYVFPTASGNSEGVLIAISGAVTSGLIVDVANQAAGSVIATSTTAGSTQSLNASAASLTTGFIDDLAIYLTSAFSGYSAVAPISVNTILNDIQNGVIFAGWTPEPSTGSATGTVSMQVNSSANAWLSYMIGIRSSITQNLLSASSLASSALSIATPLIAQTHALSAVSVASSATLLGIPSFNKAGTFTALAIATNASALGTPPFGTSSLTAISLASNAAAIGQPLIKQIAALHSINIASAAAGFAVPAFNQTDLLSILSIWSSAAMLGTPSIQVRSLDAVSLTTQSPNSLVSILAQVSGWIATSISSAVAGLDAPIFNQIETLSADSLVANSANLALPSLGSDCTASSLTADNADLGQPIFSQNNVLIPLNIASAASARTLPILNQNVFSLSALPITSQAATLATPVLDQSKNTLTGISLSSQTIGMGIPTLHGANASISSWDYVTTSPVLDTTAPSLTLTAAFNFGIPNSLISATDWFGKPVINQQHVLADAISIATNGIAVSLPQFVQFNALDAADLAAAAASIATPNIGDAYVPLSVELGFVSIDSNVYQLNAALTGITPIPALGAIANAVMLANSVGVADSDFKAVAAIAIINKAILAVTADLGTKEHHALITKATFVLGPTLMISAGTVIFNLEAWVAIATLQADSIQLLTIDNAVAIEAAITTNENMLQQTGLGLGSDTLLAADLVKPAPQQWAGSALLSPINSLTVSARQIINVSAVLQPAATLRVSSQINIAAAGLSPVTALRALAKMRMPAIAAVSPAVTAAIATTMAMKADAPLAPISSAIISGLLSANGGASLDADTKFNAELVRPSSVTFNLSPELTLSISEALRGQAFSQLGPEATVDVSELAQLSPTISLLPASVLTIKLQALLSPFALWNGQTTLGINERILPSGTAFYFVSPALAINESQILRPTVPVSLQTKLISHEGLRMLQPSITLYGSSTLSSADYSIHGPMLQLASDILLDINDVSNTAATHSDLSSEIEFENQIALWQSLESEIDNYVAMRSRSIVAMAGLSDLSPGCFIDPDVTLQHTVEISSMITAQKSRTRIVAQGNLLRKYE